MVEQGEQGQGQQHGHQQGHQQGQQQGRQPAAAPAADDAATLPSAKLVPHLQRNIIAQRVKGFARGLHPQKNRPVRDPVKHKAGLMFEEVAEGLLGIFAPLFWPVLDAMGRVKLEIFPDPYIKQAYGCLRRYAQFHLSDHDFSSQAELAAAADAAQNELLSYGKLAQQVGAAAAGAVRDLPAICENWLP